MDDPLVWFLFLCYLAIAVGIFFLVRRSRRLRRLRHRAILAAAEEEIGERSEEEDAEVATARWLQIAEEFPFLAKPKPADLSAEAIRQATLDLLFSVPSLGTFGRTGLPAPLLPPQERRRHLYVVGKTGSGKSTFLEHLIAKDLEEGRGVGVVSPEGEFFRRLLCLIPWARRESLIYFAPGDPRSPLSFNPLSVEPGEDVSRAAEDLFTIVKRALGGDDFGPRMQPILQNGFAALVGRPGATLFDLKRLLEDPVFREEVGYSTADSYVRSFWLETYPRYPKGAELPLVSRLDQFLRPEALRRGLCQKESSFSVREVLASASILFLDLYGLSEESRLLVGELLLSKFQLELLRREISGGAPASFQLYCDEFQSFAGVSEGTWRELLSRGRKYGLSLTLANQYPGQLPAGLQDEIFGNVNSLIAFALGARDAQAVRKELLVKTSEKGKVKIEPIRIEELLELPVGVAYGKLAGGRAVRLKLPGPIELRDSARGEAIVSESWRRFAAKAPVSGQAIGPPPLREPESFLE